MMSTFFLILKIIAISLGALAGIVLVGAILLALLLSRNGGNPFQ
jgi:hypothetical protein